MTDLSTHELAYEWVRSIAAREGIPLPIILTGRNADGTEMALEVASDGSVEISAEEVPSRLASADQARYQRQIGARALLLAIRPRALHQFSVALARVGIVSEIAVAMAGDAILVDVPMEEPTEDPADRAIQPAAMGGVVPPRIAVVPRVAEYLGLTWPITLTDGVGRVADFADLDIAQDPERALLEALVLVGFRSEVTIKGGCEDGARVISEETLRRVQREIHESIGARAAAHEKAAADHSSGAQAQDDSGCRKEEEASPGAAPVGNAA